MGGDHSRFAGRVVCFNNGSLDETSISRFPLELIVGELSYSPCRGSRVLWLLAYCLDVRALPASLDFVEMPLCWVEARSPQLYECLVLAGGCQVVSGYVRVYGESVVSGDLLQQPPVVRLLVCQGLGGVCASV